MSVSLSKMSQLFAFTILLMTVLLPGMKKKYIYIYHLIPTIMALFLLYYHFHFHAPSWPPTAHKSLAASYLLGLCLSSDHRNPKWDMDLSSRTVDVDLGHDLRSHRDS